MKTYKFKNATIYVYGEISKERLQKATIRLVKDSRKYKLQREGSSNGDASTSGIIRKEQILD